MTREELVEELNKIDRVKAFAHENNVHIDIGIITTSLCYKWGTKSLHSIDTFNTNHLLGGNRTPEQVLSAVKALVE